MNIEDFGNLKKNVSLKKYNTYKIGGKSKYLIKPYDVISLKNLIKLLNKQNIKYLIVGKGSNIILPDEDFHGIIIILENLNKIKIDKNKVFGESGTLLNIFINELINSNLQGLENLYGVPGTLGGAIVQNAGCFGTTISDFLISVTYLEDNKIKTISKSDCEFSYRNSIFKHNKNKIILSSEFELNEGNKKEMKKIISMNIEKRRKSQPYEYPNAGSVFRNPTNNSAGKIIEDNNLKGYSVNGAFVSDKHANFIVNKDNCTSKDIKKLINHIQKVVKEKNKIDLILEQEIIEY